MKEERGVEAEVIIFLNIIHFSITATRYKKKIKSKNK